MAEPTPPNTVTRLNYLWFFTTIFYPFFNPKSPNVPAAARPNHRNPIIETIQQQELGKSMLNLGAPIIIALLVTNPDKFHSVVKNFILTGLSAGCTSIWIGLVTRQVFPEFANVVEQTGLVLVLISFHGLIASALPMEFAWVPMICGGFCLSTFVVAALPFSHQNYTDHENV